MAIYATYTDYVENFRGTAIAQADFDRFALQASAQIDAMTFNRAAPIVTANTDLAMINYITMATCAVAEELQKLEASGGAVQSESISSNSVTYVSKLSDSARLMKAAKPYLGLTGLMYRGLDAD